MKIDCLLALLRVSRVGLGASGGAGVGCRVLGFFFFVLLVPHLRPFCRTRYRLSSAVTEFLGCRIFFFRRF